LVIIVRLVLGGRRLVFRNESLGELEILLRRQSFAIQNLVFIHASVADTDAGAGADVGVALVVLVVVDVAAAVRHVVVAEVVGGFRIGCDDKLLKFALQVGVLLDLLTDQDDSVGGQGVSGVSGQRPVLLGLAINDRGHGVALHADAQPVPASIVEARPELDLLRGGADDALVVEVDLAPDLDGEDLVAVRAVHVQQPAGLRSGARLERRQDGKVGRKFFREDPGRRDGGHAAARNLEGDVWGALPVRTESWDPLHSGRSFPELEQVQQIHIGIGRASGPNLQ
jgi:hypothetical protein